MRAGRHHRARPRRFGVGTDTAGALLVSAGDNPQRLRFAHHCGVAPIDASSGLTIRKRLNRGLANRWSAWSTTPAPAATSSGARARAVPEPGCNSRLRDAVRHWARSNARTDQYGRSLYWAMRARPRPPACPARSCRQAPCVPHRDPARRYPLRPGATGPASHATHGGLTYDQRCPTGFIRCPLKRS